MKKTLAKILLATMAISVLAGCGKKEEVPVKPEENPEAVEFKVGFDAEYPPFGYMDDNGEYTGFDLEMAKAVSEINGWKYVPVPINWDSKDMELEAGSISCIWNGFTMNGREDQYSWTKAYVDNSQVILTEEGSEIKTLADLAGKNVGVQAASSALELLKGDKADLTATFGKLQEFADYNTAFVELQAGSIDAVAIDIGVAKYQIASRGEGYKILDEVIASENYGVGFKLGNNDLRDDVQNAMDKLAEDGTVAKLAEKYGIADMVCIGK